MPTINRVSASLWFLLFAWVLSPTGACGAVSIDTSVSTDWKISNGDISLDWNSTTGNVFGVFLAGHADNLVDLTQTSHGQPKGLYMDNTGLGGGASSASYYLGDHFIDWWITTPSNAGNAFTYSQHFILTDHGSGFHVYFSAKHAASDISGGLGQIQWVFRISQTLFTHTHSVNTALNSLGPVDIALPASTVLGTADPGRQVQDATVDLHGLALPAGFPRQFYTKYDYSSYEYLHRGHGLYGDTYGAWTVIPQTDTQVGGPTKQDLIFTGTILMMEALSGHLDNNITYSAAAGTAADRLFGPYYFHFNAFTARMGTAEALYKEAQAAGLLSQGTYDKDPILIESGFVPSSKRGEVRATVGGSCVDAPHRTWMVLSDQAVNFQYSSAGHQYWANDCGKDTSLTRVAPGSYRLSAYTLGEWGELRRDQVGVDPGAATDVRGLQFTPENFGASDPVWQIGTPDRSAHEFLHGVNASGADDREFWGNWNYWSDFAATGGAALYYATAVGSEPATNDLSKWNYVQWGTFHPGLFAGVYNAADDSTDGYKYIVPPYASNYATASVPPWQIHFTTTAEQQAQGRFAVISVGLASAEASLIASLNGGPPLVWHLTKASDAMLRSGLSGTYQWIAFQFDTSQLSAAGQDNVLSLSVNRPSGVMYDAVRMEITDRSADPTVTGWHDYEFLYRNTDTPADDTLQNQ